MSLVVMKFGGTSVADAERIHRAARRSIRAKEEGHQVVMVVSARGKTTDKLIALAKEICPDPPRRELDMLMTTGEQESMSLMAMAIFDAGHEAISLTGGQIGLITDSVHTKARIQKIDAERIRKELASEKIVIVAGFQGIDEAGEIYTLGRGASDTTAVALAAVLGAGVMHSRAIEFGKKYNVDIHVRSSFSDTPGTLITREVKQMEQIVVSGVTVKQDIAQFVVQGLPNRPGVAASMFAHIAKYNVVVDDIIQTSDASGTASTSFTVDHSDLAECKLVIDEIRKEFDLSEAQVICKDPVAKVSAVGVGMRTHTGVAEMMFRALADSQININAITTSEIKISCIINPEQSQAALRAMHSAFGLDQDAESPQE